MQSAAGKISSYIKTELMTLHHYSRCGGQERHPACEKPATEIPKGYLLGKICVSSPVKNRKLYVYYYYLRQVNGVNGRDTVFIKCVSVCARSGPVKMVKATDFKFDKMFPVTVRT